VQRPRGDAGGKPAIRFGCRAPRALGIQRHDRVQQRVDLRDAGEVCIHDLHRRELAAPDASREIGRALLPKRWIAHLGGNAARRSWPSRSSGANGERTDVPIRAPAFA
jgi:hypothetical protein